jgi:hypothetical protein
VFFELNKPTFNELFIQFSSDSIELELPSILEGIMFVMQNLFFPPFIFKVYLIFVILSILLQILEAISVMDSF